MNCLYDDINPGIEKITAPNRYQYHAATSADGKKYLSIKARKNPTPAFMLRVDWVKVVFLEFPYSILLSFL